MTAKGAGSLGPAGPGSGQVPFALVAMHQLSL
jgi:hypothetical protein